MNFATSTQARFWLFSSPSALEQARSVATAAALRALQQQQQQQHGGHVQATPAVASSDTVAPAADNAPSKSRKRRVDSGAPESSSKLIAVDTSAAAAAAAPPPPPPLSADEEALLRRYFESQTVLIADTLSLPKRVARAAIIYLKRLFVHHSVLSFKSEQNTLNVCTAVLLACKTEEYHVSVPEFASVVKRTVDELLGNEVPFLAALRFHLVVFHPHRALAGFIQQLSTSTNTPTTPASGAVLTLEQASALQDSSLELLDQLYTTDAPLLFTPAQCALAALQRSAAAASPSQNAAVAALVQAALGAHPQQQGELQAALTSLQPYFDAGAQEAPSKRTVEQLLARVRRARKTKSKRSAAAPAAAASAASASASMSGALATGDNDGAADAGSGDGE